MNRPAVAATGQGQSQAQADRITRAEAAIEAHKELDDNRFESLTKGMDEVKRDLHALSMKVDDLKDDVHEIKRVVSAKSLSSGDGEGPPGHWHISPMGQWLIGLAAAALLGLVGWLGSQVYSLQTAREYEAEHPAPIPVISERR